MTFTSLATKRGIFTEVLECDSLFSSPGWVLTFFASWPETLFLQFIKSQKLMCKELLCHEVQPPPLSRTKAAVPALNSQAFATSV